MTPFRIYLPTLWYDFYLHFFLAGNEMVNEVVLSTNGKAVNVNPISNHISNDSNENTDITVLTVKTTSV